MDTLLTTPNNKEETNNFEQMRSRHDNIRLSKEGETENSTIGQSNDDSYHS